MADLVDLAQAKVHLRLGTAPSAQDDYIEVLITAATRACEKQMGRGIDDEDFNQSDLPIVEQAVLLLVAAWFSHREASITDSRSMPVEMPLAVTWLLGPLSKVSIA